MKHLLAVAPVTVFVFFVVFAAPVQAEVAGDAQAPRPRLAVMTDIGVDPDDQQSLVRLMVYANEFEIEALIATSSGTPGELQEQVTRVDLIHRTIDAYAEVLPNLERHAAGWPSAEALRDVVRTGNRLRMREHIGPGHDTPGSQHLVERIDAGSAERPLNVCIWGGQTDLAQALYSVKQSRGPEGLAAFVKRFRAYDIGDQDRLAEWMRAEFPGMTYILSKAPADRDKRESTFRGMYLTGDESLTSREWVERHVRNGSALGAIYPTKTYTPPNPHACLKECDTATWFFFLPRGGNDPHDPTKPGWGGRYRRQADGWYGDFPMTDDYDPRHTISSRRPEFQADFAKRMSWCLP